MKRVAVFIDAGYFWVQLCQTLTGVYDSRAQVIVDFSALRARLLSEVATQFPSAELLRVYWYDGPGSSGSKTAEHISIDALDDFKLRLGSRNGTGQQKGVDGLMIADLISLTQQRAISSALLVSGDGDTAPGVIAAQGMGLRVHLLSLGTALATSPSLAAEVDLKRSWTLTDVSTFATQNTSVIVSAPVASPAGAQLPAPDLGAIAQACHNQITAGPLNALLLGRVPGTFSLPPEVDRALLGLARSQLQRQLTDQEKPLLRAEFRKLLP